MSDWGKVILSFLVDDQRMAHKKTTIAEESDSEPSTKGKTSNPAIKTASAAPPVKKPIAPGKGKWEGEDEEDSEPVVSNWPELCPLCILNHIYSRATGKNPPRKSRRRRNLRLLPLREKRAPLKPNSQK